MISFIQYNTGVTNVSHHINGTPPQVKFFSEDAINYGVQLIILNFAYLICFLTNLTLNTAEFTGENAFLQWAPDIYSFPFFFNYSL